MGEGLVSLFCPPCVVHLKEEFNFVQCEASFRHVFVITCYVIEYGFVPVVSKFFFFKILNISNISCLLFSISLIRKFVSTSTEIFELSVKLFPAGLGSLTA